MLNLRYIARLVQAFASRFKGLIIISVVLGIAFFFLIKLLLPVFYASASQRTGLSGRFTTASLPQDILSMIGDGLTKLNEAGDVEPNLAKSWETPDKGKTWIFHLDTGRAWQDGKKVTADNVSYQFSDVMLEKPDAKTLVFKLQSPYSAFPSVVSRPIFRRGLLGTGLWEVKNLKLAGVYVDEITLQKKDKTKIVYKFYPTEERTKLAFELGEVDEIREIINVEPFNKWSKVKIDKDSNAEEYVAIFFNTQDKLMGEKNLRQALSYAINKEALPGTRALGPISMSSWAYNPQVKPYFYDPEKAKAMIQDYKKTSKLDKVEVNLTAPPLLYDEAQSIEKDWEAVGVEVNLQVLASIPTDYQALLAIFNIPVDPDQYSIWHSTQIATNITHYQNPRIDKLLEDGRSAINIEDRKKIYFDFQRFLVEDSPAAFLYYPTTYTVKRN